MNHSVNIQDRPKTKEKFKNLEELKPYRRNIQTILQIAKIQDINVVITTQPYSTQPPAHYPGDAAVHIAQTNQILRELYAMYPDNNRFVDLDEKMTGSNELYTDLAHVTWEGRKRKAKEIGNAILHDLRSAPQVGYVPKN